MTCKSWCLNKTIRKRRAITPLIATILLIALIVIGATVVSAILFTTMNAPSPVEVQVTNVGNFASNDYSNNLQPIDGKVDELTVVIQNIGRDPIVLSPQNIYILNGTNQTPINGWIPNIDIQDILMTGYTAVRIPMVCVSNARELDVGKQIFIGINGTKPQNAPEGYNPSPYTSPPFLIKDISGPLEVTNENSLSSINFLAGETTISQAVEVKNWGTLPIDATVELFLDTSKIKTNTTLQTNTINPKDNKSYTLYFEKVDPDQFGEVIATIKIKADTKVYALLTVSIAF